MVLNTIYTTEETAAQIEAVKTKFDVTGKAVAYYETLKKDWRAVLVALSKMS